MSPSASGPTRSRRRPAPGPCTTSPGSRTMSRSRRLSSNRRSRTGRISLSSFRWMTSRWSNLKNLNDANIPVVVAGNALPGREVTFVGADDVEIGYRQARYLFEKLGGKGKIVVIEGVPAAPTNRDRLRGYQRAFAEFPGIAVLGTG